MYYLAGNTFIQKGSPSQVVIGSVVLASICLKKEVISLNEYCFTSRRKVLPV